MKILIFLKKWAGGVGVVVGATKKELEKEGHKVICISREEDLKTYSSVKNLFWLRKRYKAIIKKENPDIIYTQDWSMALPLIFPFFLYNKKHFACFHGSEFGISGLFQKITGELLGKRLVVVGDPLKKRFSRSNMIYNGLDLDLFKPNKKVKKVKNSVGFVNWKTEDYHYEEIKVACKKLGRELVVAENISYKNMPKFYQKLECFISLPPKGAGFNMSWIEAMSCGVPRIIGNDEGIGIRLNIDKIKERESMEHLIKRAKSRKYERIIDGMSLDWKICANKLLETFKQ